MSGSGGEHAQHEVGALSVTTTVTTAGVTATLSAAHKFYYATATGDDVYWSMSANPTTAGETATAHHPVIFNGLVKYPIKTGGGTTIYLETDNQNATLVLEPAVSSRF